MWPAWSATSAFFDSEMVYLAVPYLIGSWVVGFAFGMIFKLLRDGFSAWLH